MFSRCWHTTNSCLRIWTWLLMKPSKAESSFKRNSGQCQISGPENSFWIDNEPSRMALIKGSSTSVLFLSQKFHLCTVCPQRKIQRIYRTFPKAIAAADMLGGEVGEALNSPRCNKKVAVAIKHSPTFAALTPDCLRRKRACVKSYIQRNLA